MTVDEQLRELARHADRHQRAITADEILQRASGGDLAAPARHTSRPWVLAAAAVIVVVVLGVFALRAGDDSEGVRVDTVPVTEPPAAGVEPGPIVFAADASAGDALRDPIDFYTVETDPQPMDIYVTDDGETRRLVSTDTHERCPTFSPDGERFAYLQTSPSGDDPTIVVVRMDALDDPELRIPLPPNDDYGVRLANGPLCPQWSPDGSRLAYLAYPHGLGSERDAVAEIRVSTLDGEERVVNAEALAYYDSAVAWSPEGDAIAYAASGGVWMAPLDGGAPSPLWRLEDTPWGGRVTDISWSARGELVFNALTVWVEFHSYSTFTSGDTVEVHVVDPEADTDEVLDDPCHGWVWSPDGSRLACVGDQGRILVHDRDAGTTTRLRVRQEDGRLFEFGDVEWSPDGERLLAFARRIPIAIVDEQGMALVSLTPDGSSVEVLTPWNNALDWVDLDDVSWQSVPN